MTDVERALEMLAAELEWPVTPAFDVRRPRRRVWLAGVALAAVALAATLAVPQARSAFLRVLHLGGVTVERVDTLPAAQERPLASTLGAPVDAARARELLGRPFEYPSEVRAPLHASGPAVSMLFAVGGRPVVLSELRTGAASYILKKIVGDSSDVRPVVVGGSPGLWIAGAEHVYVAPTVPPRLAGNTLLVQRGAITYRLEGPALTLARARALAEQLVGG